MIVFLVCVCFFGLFGFFVCVLIYVVIIFGFYLKQTVYKQTCVYKHVGLMSGWSERRGMINLRADADVSTSNMLLLPIKIATIESMIMSRFDALSRTPNIDFRGKKNDNLPQPENAPNPYIYMYNIYLYFVYHMLCNICVYMFIYLITVYIRMSLFALIGGFTRAYIFHPTRQSFLYTHCHATAVDNIHAETWFMLCRCIVSSSPHAKRTFKTISIEEDGDHHRHKRRWML